MEQSGTKTVLVLGGARSGKSAFALARANSLPGRKAFLATGQAFDDEMHKRIAAHQEERGPEWETVEEPTALAEAVRSIGPGYAAVVVDCLTLWVSNLLLGNHDIRKASDDFLSLLREPGHPPLIVVSNEVGLGIVPENALARAFRDEAGRLNQKIAAAAGEVFLVTAGIPLRIKPQEASWI